jgi:cell division protein FtsZ
MVKNGLKADHNMYDKSIYEVSFMVCDTDAVILGHSPVETKILLTCNKMDNDIGANRVLSSETKAQISNYFNDCNMAVIVAGMGGETGDDLLPEMTRLIRDMKILTVCVVTVPFSFEGDLKVARAHKSIEKLKKHVDSVFVVENELLKKLHPDLNLSSAFDILHNVLYDITDAIFNAILVPGFICIGFVDLYYVLRNSSECTIGFGIGEGENRVIAAIEDAYNYPLFNSAILNGKNKYFIMIWMSSKHPMVEEELKELNSFVSGFEDDVVLWQNCLNENLNTKIKVDLWVTKSLK